MGAECSEEDFTAMDMKNCDCGDLCHGPRHGCGL